nr:MAG TPA: hypothetical protein [Caudoviricetes sp.]
MRRCDQRRVALSNLASSVPCDYGAEDVTICGLSFDVLG